MIQSLCLQNLRPHRRSSVALHRCAVAAAQSRVCRDWRAVKCSRRIAETAPWSHSCSMQPPAGLSLWRRGSRTLATAHHEIAKRGNITVSATLHAAFVFWEFCQKLRWKAEIDCTRALGSWAMQSARVHSVVRASPAAFPQHVKGQGSLARSPLSNHDQAQQMFVRKPQLGEAISTVDSRENVVPPRCPRCAAQQSPALADADAPNSCLFSQPSPQA